MRHFVLSTIFTLTTLATGSHTLAQNWDNWMGPNYDGVSPAKKLLMDWTPEKNTIWKTELPFRGAATPVLWDEVIVLTSNDGDKNAVLGFDMNGKELWRTHLGIARKGKNPKATGANSSPVTDDKNVFVYFKSGELACLDFKGNVVWRTNLQEKYGKDTLWWDLATSPVVSKDSVIVAVMQAGPSYIVAFDKKSGEVNWKIDRTYSPIPKENDQAYTTPTIIEEDGKEVMILWGADHITAYDLGNKGKLIWTCAGMNPDGKAYKRAIASAVVHQGHMVIPFDRQTRIAGLKIGGTGDITDKAHLWMTKTPAKSNKVPQSSDVPTPCAKDGLAYVLSDFGKIACMKVTDGTVVWSGELGEGREKFSGSPTIVGDKLVAVRDSGEFYVLQLGGDEFKMVSQSHIGETLIARPIFLDDKILIRTDKNLVLLGKK